jgi:hypothetical protein
MITTQIMHGMSSLATREREIRKREQQANGERRREVQGSVKFLMLFKVVPASSSHRSVV